MLTTRVRGIEIKGAVTRRTAEYLEVAITHPFTGVKMSARVPSFNQSDANFDSPHGDEWARILLKRIHELCEYTMRNIDWLWDEYITLKQRLDKLDSENLPKEEYVYRVFFEKLRFFQRNYPRMNVQEGCWEELLSLIEESVGFPARAASQ